MPSRPVCRRCGKPLTLWYEDGEWQLLCEPLMAVGDDQFWAAWDQLPGDDVVRLTRERNLVIEYPTRNET